MPYLAKEFAQSVPASPISPPSPTTLPEAGEAATHQGAGSRVRCTAQPARCSKQGAGLLHTEPEEGGIVSARELGANASIDH